jgi:hypothetical protein
MQTRPITATARIVLFLLEVFRPLFLLIGFVLRIIYQILFSWWMNPLYDNWVRDDFAKDIRNAIPSLFDRHGGRVVPDPKPYVNDENMDYVCVACPSLIFKFRRWHRENYRIEIAPTFAPADSYEVIDALLLVDPQADVEQPMLDVDWRRWENLLEPRFGLLEHAFDAEHFAETKAMLLSRQSRRRSVC